MRDPDKPHLRQLADAQVAIVFACRSNRLSVARFGWFSNPLIRWGVVIELTILALITYTSLGNDIFRTGPSAWIFGPLALGALVLLCAGESREIIVNRFGTNRAGAITQQAGGS